MKKVSLLIAIALVGIVQVTECASKPGFMKSSLKERGRAGLGAATTFGKTGSVSRAKQTYQRQTSVPYRAGRYVTEKGKQAGKWMEKKGEQAYQYGRKQAERFSDWRQTRIPHSAHR